MRVAFRGTALLALQAVLVLSTAGKYEWEKHTRPMVWTQVQPFGVWALPGMASSATNDGTDAEDRYMQVQLTADACGLPPKPPENATDYSQPQKPGSGIFPTYPQRNASVKTVAKNGKLVAVEIEGAHIHGTEQLEWDMRKPCNQARLLEIVKFYVPKESAMPKNLKSGQTVWALVTVPEQGPPRPIELAISDATGFHPLGQK